MKILDILNKKDKILVIPSELKTYFLELREINPLLHFKLFTINELIKELYGNFDSVDAIKLGFQFFPNLTYSSIKETLEVVYKAFDIEKSNDPALINFRNELIDKKYLNFNKDLEMLLKSKEVVFINFNDSSFIKNLIKKLELINYSFLELTDVIEEVDNFSYHSFFNIADETHYSLNEVMNRIDNGVKPNDVEVILDTKRFDYYLNLLLSGYDVPYEIENENTLVNTKTFKFIYKYLDDDSVNILDILNENKETINDPNNIETIIELLNTFDVDNLNNRKTNIIEILNSKKRYKENVINTIKFKSSMTFSLKKHIFVLGLDHTFIPKAKKDNKVYSYKIRNLMGLDSLDELNLMNSKLEQAFIKQKNIDYISFHKKDNSGRYDKSYYLNAFGKALKENKLHNVEYSKKAMNFYYRVMFDKFERSGIISPTFLAYKKFFNNEKVLTYSPEFKQLTNFTFNEKTKFSYSALSQYNKCPFKYFVQYLLKDNVFEGNFNTKAGNLGHLILTHVYEDGFDFNKIAETSFNEQIKNGETYDKRELVLLVRFLTEVKRTSEFIRESKNEIIMDSTYSEKEINAAFTIKDYEIIKLNNKETLKEFDSTIKIYGRIDRIIETIDNSLYIIDYKTGSEKFKASLFEKYNESMQLPFYLFLVETSKDKLFMDKNVAGLFIQPLIMQDKKFFNYFNPTNEDYRTIYLSGIFENDVEKIAKFDKSLEIDENTESAFIDGCKLKKDRKLKSSGGSTAKETLENYKVNLKGFIGSCYLNIKNGYFSIDPLQKRFNKDDLDACKFCNFKDICFTRIDKEEE